MARIRIYKLYSTGVATASSVASITVPQAGLVTSIHWSSSMVGGATATSGILTELSLSSVSTLTQNDTPGNSLSTVSVSSNVSGGQSSVNDSTTNLGIPVVAGDKLYLHELTNGTAPASKYLMCHVSIMH